MTASITYGLVGEVAIQPLVDAVGGVTVTGDQRGEVAQLGGLEVVLQGVLREVAKVVGSAGPWSAHIPSEGRPGAGPWAFQYQNALPQRNPSTTCPKQVNARLRRRVPRARSSAFSSRLRYWASARGTSSMAR
ncbi:hypothetical protein [Amycolatopsis sp. NPDC051128]|uniref:hypothetical protein n=1 Tax=Amycolatopsis sp. NPDC051128 TaxID=3155412 RepID=UPI003432AC2F